MSDTQYEVKMFLILQAMYRTLEALKHRFEEHQYWGNIYRIRMASKGTGENGHPKNTGSWAHDTELHAMATYLRSSIVFGIYRRDGSIGWVPYHPVTAGFSIMSPDRNLDNGPAVYILHTGSNPSDPIPIDRANHYRVLMGVRKPSTIPGLPSADSNLINPQGASRPIPKPSTGKVNIIYIISIPKMNV